MLDDHETPALDALSRDIDRLRAGCSLLERIWQAMPAHGPFPETRRLSTQEIPAAEQETRDEGRRLVIDMQTHFGFDDSE